MSLHEYPCLNIDRDILACVDNWRLISIKHGYPFMDIYCSRISIAECPCMDIRAWISMWISSLVWIIEDWYPKIMDIQVDIRGFLEIHAWICYGFSDQGCVCATVTRALINVCFRTSLQSLLSSLKLACMHKNVWEDGVCVSEIPVTV